MATDMVVFRSIELGGLLIDLLGLFGMESFRQE